MNDDNYLIQFEQIKNYSIQDFLKKLNETQGKNLYDLKLKDLTYHNSTPIFPGTGVYIFRYNKELVYVGKASSMSFTERIPKHFDLRNYAWFNRLLEIICIKKLNIKWDDKGAAKASEYAFNNLNLILINFDDNKQIERIERLLRSHTNCLNKFKNLKETNFERIIGEY